MMLVLQMTEKEPSNIGMSDMELTSGGTLFKIIAWLNTLASKSESGLNSPHVLRTQQKNKLQTWNGHRLFLWAKCAPLPETCCFLPKNAFQLS